MAAGHFMMAFEPLFYFALATIALGNGLFLPSLPSQINDLYGPDDPRRGWAYNVYYVGVNIGGFLAPLVCGTLGETLRLALWLRRRRASAWSTGPRHLSLGPALSAAEQGLPRRRVVTGAQARTAADRETYLLLLAIGLAVTVFRGAYEQVGNTVALWIDDGVDRVPAPSSIPMTWFQSLNPLLVIVMTPLLLARWTRADRARAASCRRCKRWRSGAAIVAASYLLLAAAADALSAAARHWLWLVAFFVVFTLGELFILPTGLGLFARLAPPEIRRDHRRRLVPRDLHRQPDRGLRRLLVERNFSAAVFPRPDRQSRWPLPACCWRSTATPGGSKPRASRERAEEQALAAVPEGLARPAHG